MSNNDNEKRCDRCKIAYKGDYNMDAMQETWKVVKAVAERLLSAAEGMVAGENGPDDMAAILCAEADELKKWAEKIRE